MMIEHKTQTTKKKEPTKEQKGQMDTTTQVKGAPPQISVIDKEKLEEEKEIPNEKE